MQRVTESVLRLNPPGGVFDYTVIINLFPDASAGARKALVHRAVTSGEVIRIIPGIYQLAKPFRLSEIHPFCLAARLHSPSHISLESALSYHSLISEAIFQVSSVTTLRSRVFQTPVGTFEFKRVPSSNPLAGVVATLLADGMWVYIAVALRAIADLVYLNNMISWSRDGLAFLTDSMRIEPEDLKQLSFDDCDDICSAIRDSRVRNYLMGLEMELAR